MRYGKKLSGNTLLLRQFEYVKEIYKLDKDELDVVMLLVIKNINPIFNLFFDCVRDSRRYSNPNSVIQSCLSINTSKREKIMEELYYKKLTDSKRSDPDINDFWLRAVETLRDIHDKTNVPIVLVGMGTANKRLQRHKHLYDRLLEIIKFEPFCKQDITSIIDQLSEVQFTDCAKKLLYSRTNRFRQLVKTISKAEQVAKSNGIKEIDEITLKEVLKNDEIDTEEIEFSNENS